VPNGNPINIDHFAKVIISQKVSNFIGAQKLANCVENDEDLIMMNISYSEIFLKKEQFPPSYIYFILIYLAVN